jgi:hypothetical protein
VKRYRMVAAAAALAVSAGVTGDVAAGNPAVASAATSVTVTVDQATTGRVDTGFAGFSYEKNEVGLGLFDAHNTRLVTLFRLLGPGVLRIGGNTNDSVTWDPHGGGGRVHAGVVGFSHSQAACSSRASVTVAVVTA